MGIILIFLMTFPSGLIAQQNEVDSLKNQLSSQEVLTEGDVAIYEKLLDLGLRNNNTLEELRAYREKALDFFASDPRKRVLTNTHYLQIVMDANLTDEIKIILDEIQEDGKTQDDEEIQVLVHFSEALNHKYFGKFSLAKEKINLVEAYLNKTNQKDRFYVKSKILHGAIYYHQILHVQAFEEYSEAYKIANVNNWKDLLSICTFRMGSIHLLSSNFELSIQNFLDVLSMYKSLQMNPTDVYYNLALVHMYARQFDKALNYQELFEEVAGELDHADYMVKAEIQSRLGNFGLAAVEYKKILEMMKDADESIKEFSSISVRVYEALSQKRILPSTEINGLIQRAENIKEPWNQASTFQNLGTYFINVKDYRNAIKFIRKTVDFIEDLNFTLALPENYTILIEAHSQLGEFKEASNYLLKLNELISTRGLSEKLALKLLEQKLNQEKEEILRDTLQKELEQKADLKQQKLINLFLTILGIIAFMMLIFANFLYKRQKNSNTLLKDQQEKLNDLNKKKDKLLAILSHDLRAPFSNLLNILQLVQMNVQGTREKSEETLGKIKLDTEKILQDISNVLSYTSSQFKEVSTAQKLIQPFVVAHDLLHKLSNQYERKNIRIENMISPGQEVFFDPNHLEIILRNLVNNAIKFTKAKGEIRLETSREDEFLKLTISDTGIGIKPELLPYIFEDSMDKIQTDTSGQKSMGLGLMICKELIEKNGGKIAVQSEEGKGSQFIIHLPLAPATTEIS